MQTILIAGGTGLIGQRLSFLLKQKGYRILLLSRTQNLEGLYTTYSWDITKNKIDKEAIEQADYVINLAGAGIADKRWSTARKQLIIDSRVQGNELLQHAFLTIKKPKAYISAAAIGFYGDRGQTLVDELSTAGEQGFMMESCVLWEHSIHALERATKVRTAIIRVGIVLSTLGGALEKMLLPFKARIGSYFGTGTAMYSWIHLDDICGIFIKAVEDETIHGIYNGVAPNPISNKQLTYAVKEVLGTNSLVVPAPDFALRLAMGEMADVVLTSTNVSAKKIEQAGYQFQFPEAVGALRDLMKRRL